MTKPQKPRNNWWKNKPKKGGKIYAPRVPLPGTKNMRQHAMFVLKAERQDSEHWHVTGGGEDNIVTNLGRGNLSCNCALSDQGVICIHVIKVMYELKIIPKNI
jgi:hypothetical protein